MTEASRSSPEHRGRRFEPGRSADVRLLEATLESFNRVGARIWLDQGTLLGLVREDELLPQDPDLDLGLWWEDWQIHKVALERSLRSAGLDVLVEAHMITVTSSREPQTRPVNIALYHPSGGHGVKRFRRRRKDARSRVIRYAIGAATGGFVTETLIRLARVLRRMQHPRLQREGDRVSVWVRMLSCQRHKLLRALRLAQLRDRTTMDFTPVVSPVEHFSELEPATINSTRAWLPREPERYLAFKYGSDWEVPRLEWNYWTDDGGVRGPSAT